MARIRTIKPEFPQSESMGRVSREARLCFVMLWTIADDFGRLRGNSRALASLLFPYDDDAPKHIDGWLSELEAEGSIRRYEVEGNHYIDIPKWSEHQKVDNPAKNAKYPEFRESVENPREDRREPIPGPRTKDQGPRTINRSPDGFAEFWKVYPRKVGRKKALALYSRLVAGSEVAESALLAAATRYAAECRGKDPSFIAHPKTWLSDGRWSDEPANAPAGNAAPMTAEQAAASHRATCERYLKKLAAGEPWPSFMGPAPGEEGTRVPADLLAQYEHAWKKPKVTEIDMTEVRHLIRPMTV